MTTSRPNASVPFRDLHELYSIPRLKQAAKHAGLHHTAIQTRHRRNRIGSTTADLLAAELGTHVDLVWPNYPTYERAR